MSYASELSRRLADRAEAVCRAYLPNGRRSGRYWIAGDVQGSRGKSLFVKLTGTRAGKWMDAATGEHGDLLDLIRLNKGCAEFRDTLEEARLFLREPERIRASRKMRTAEPPHDTLAAAEKLYSLSRPVPGTLAETYLRARGITARLSWPCLRFIPLAITARTAKRRARAGPRSLALSPTPPEISPAFSAPISPATAAAKPRLPIQDAP